MPDVSVILPVYNAGQTIQTAVASILAQPGVTFELIIVDDGSTDASATFLQTLDYPGVKVFSIGHSGIVAALNTGIKHARGQYIARMDADDYSYPLRLARQKQFLQQHPDIGLVGCRVEYGGRRRDGAGYAKYVDWTNGLMTPTQISQSRFVEAPFVHPSIMFRRSLVEKLGGYTEGAFPEDYDLLLRWLAGGVRMSRVPETLLRWNDHPRRISRNHHRYSLTAFYELKARYLAQWLAQNNPHHPEVLVWGAGRVTRKRTDPLKKYGIQCVGFIDIDRRKTGSPLRGLPRFYYLDMPGPDQAFVLTYVGVRNAREFNAAFLKTRGFVEGKHFLHCA